MLDPSLCTKTPASSWASLSWMLYGGLTNAKLVLPILLTTIILPWFTRLRLKRVISVIGGVLLVAYLGLSSPNAIAMGNRFLAAFLPHDPGVKADAIVVLGRGGELRSERVQVAADLWKEKRAPLIFASGRGDAEEIAAMLESQGVPAVAIEGEPCSSTTEENALFTAQLLKPKDHSRIILVTDLPHMMRSLLTYQSLGYDVIPHVSPLPVHMSQRLKGFLVLRESIGLISYGLLGRYRPRDPGATPWLHTASAPLTDKIQSVPN